MKYCVKVAAYTRVGLGPFTQNKCFEMSEASLLKSKMSDSQTSIKTSLPGSSNAFNERAKYYLKQPWFISMATIVLILACCLVLYAVWTILRRVLSVKERHKRGGKNASSRYLSSENCTILNGTGTLAKSGAVHKMDNGNRYKLVNDQTIWLDTLYSSNNSNNQDCCCVPDIPHQLFIQSKL
jgi:hypothetical protein